MRRYNTHYSRGGWILSSPTVLINMECEAALPFDPHESVVYQIFVVSRGIRPVKEDGSKRNSETFDITRLFEAVASGDGTKLSTLHQYLHQNMKKLSNSLCKCDNNNSTAAPSC